MELEGLMKEAEDGRAYWLDHCLEDYDNVLLLCEMEEEHSNMFLDLFEQKLAATGGRGIILTQEALKRREFCQVLICDKKVTGQIIRLYSLYEFTDRLIIGSLKEPYGRSIGNYEGFKGMTLREAVSMAIFEMEDGGRHGG